MLGRTRAGGDVRALRQLAVARRLSQTPGDGPLLSVLEDISSTRGIIETPAEVFSVAVSPDGTRASSGFHDAIVRHGG